jgi:hypothetical protein
MLASAQQKTTPILPKEFWREISSENFKSAQTKREANRRYILRSLLRKICSKFDDKLCKEFSRNKFPVLLTTR